MDKKEKIIKNSMLGLTYIYSPWIFSNLGFKVISFSEVSSIETMYWAFVTNGIDLIFAFITLKGVFTIIGVFFELLFYVYRKEWDSLNALKHASDIEGNSIIFWVHYGKLYERKAVSLNKLSSKTRETILNKIKEPLWEIYKLAEQGKRTRSAYNACSEYINSIADDLDNAIQQCDNEQMEDKLISKLYILEDMLAYIKSKVVDAAEMEEEERQFYNKLSTQEYNPFTITENLSKLI